MLAEALGECVNFLAYLKTFPTPEPAPSPPPYVTSHPTFYVFATGAVPQDANSTNYVLIRSVVSRLTRNYRYRLCLNQKLSYCDFSTPLPMSTPQGALVPDEDLWIVGHPDWTSVATFVAQCQLDPNTRGALVIEGPLPQNSINNWLLFQKNWQVISSAFEVIGCGEFDHDPSITPLALLNRQEVTGQDREITVPFGILASIGALFATQSSTVTTTTIPSAAGSDATAKRGKPTPGPTTSTTTTTNALNWPLVVSSAATSVATQNVPSINGTLQTNAAAFALVDNLFNNLRMACQFKEAEVAHAASLDGEREINSGRFAFGDDMTDKVPSPVPGSVDTTWHTKLGYPHDVDYQRRSLAMKAAYEFVNDDCYVFADFAVPIGFH